MGPLPSTSCTHHIRHADGTGDWQQVWNTTKLFRYRLSFRVLQVLPNVSKPMNAAQQRYKPSYDGEVENGSICMLINSIMWTTHHFSTYAGHKMTVKSYSKFPPRAFGPHLVIYTISQTVSNHQDRRNTTKSSESVPLVPNSIQAQGNLVNDEQQPHRQTRPNRNPTKLMTGSGKPPLRKVQKRNIMSVKSSSTSATAVSESKLYVVTDKGQKMTRWKRSNTSQSSLSTATGKVFKKTIQHQASRGVTKQFVPYSSKTSSHQTFFTRMTLHPTLKHYVAKNQDAKRNTHI